MRYVTGATVARFTWPIWFLKSGRMEPARRRRKVPSTTFQVCQRAWAATPAMKACWVEEIFTLWRHVVLGCAWKSWNGRNIAEHFMIPNHYGRWSLHLPWIYSDWVSRAPYRTATSLPCGYLLKTFSLNSNGHFVPPQKSSQTLFLDVFGGICFIGQCVTLQQHLWTKAQNRPWRWRLQPRHKVVGSILVWLWLEK